MTIFAARLLKHLAILFLVSLPLEIIGIIIIPFILLYIGKDPKFPTIFKWFDNADHWIGRDTSTYDAVIQSGFLNRYYFIAFRNPNNYFGYAVLGFVPKDITMVSVSGTYDNVEAFAKSPVGDGDNPGLFHIEYLIDGVTRYEYYYIKTYAFLGVKRCVRFRMGYKLGLPTDLKPGDRVQEVLVLAPLHSYSGS